MRFILQDCRSKSFDEHGQAGSFIGSKPRVRKPTAAGNDA
jgi:hypothetical protein